MSAPRRRRDDGLQPERTSLAWNRTSLGMLGNAALLAVHDVYHYAGPLRILPAVLALLLAAATYLIGRHRNRILRQRPLPTPLDARRPIRWVGGSLILLILVTAFTLPV